MTRTCRCEDLGYPCPPCESKAEDVAEDYLSPAAEDEADASIWHYTPGYVPRGY